MEQRNGHPSRPESKGRRIARNTLALYVRMLFTLLVSLYTSRVVLDVLGVTDYGIYDVVAGFVSMFSFLSGAMASSTQRFLTYELGRGAAGHPGAVFSSSLVLHGGLAVVVAVVAETAGLWFLCNRMAIPPERLTAAVSAFHFSVAASAVVVTSIPFEAVVIARERMDFFAKVSILEVLLKLLIVYLLGLGGADKLVFYAFLMLAVQLATRSVYAVYCRRRFPEAHFVPVRDRGLLRRLTGFAGWNLFGDLAAVAFTQGVNLLLNLFFGPAVNAARAVAMQVRNAVCGFALNVQTAMNPQITKSYAQGDLGYMHRLVYAGTKVSFFSLMALSLPVMLEVGQILGWWLKEVPPHADAFVRLVLLIAMVDALAGPLIQSAQATGRIRRYQTVLGSLLLCIVPLSYVALRLGSPPEAVFAVHLAVAVGVHVVRVWMLRPMIGLSLRAYAANAVLPIAVVALVSPVVPSMLYVLLPGGVGRFLLVTVVGVLSVASTAYVFGLTAGERRYVAERLVRWRYKMKHDD